MILIVSVKLPDYGLESSIPGPSKEDERIAALANKARKGDYDEGDNSC